MNCNEEYEITDQDGSDIEYNVDEQIEIPDEIEIESYWEIETYFESETFHISKSDFQLQSQPTYATRKRPHNFLNSSVGLIEIYLLHFSLQIISTLDAFKLLITDNILCQLALNNVKHTGKNG